MIMCVSTQYSLLSTSVFKHNWFCVWVLVLSTQYSVLSTQYSVLSTSVFKHQWYCVWVLVLSTQYSVPSTKYSVHQCLNTNSTERKATSLMTGWLSSSCYHYLFLCHPPPVTWSKRVGRPGSKNWIFTVVRLFLPGWTNLWPHQWAVMREVPQTGDDLILVAWNPLANIQFTKELPSLLLCSHTGRWWWRIKTKTTRC